MKEWEEANALAQRSHGQWRLAEARYTEPGDALNVAQTPASLARAVFGLAEQRAAEDLGFRVKGLGLGFRV